MSEANITRPTMAAYKAALLAASAEGRFPAEGKRTGSHNLSCRYLTDSGKRCAIGILLPDDVADKLDESPLSSAVGSPLVWELVSKYTPLDLDKSTAIKIQHCHDEIARTIRNTKYPWPHQEFATRIETILGAVTAPH